MRYVGPAQQHLVQVILCLTHCGFKLMHYCKKSHISHTPPFEVSYTNRDSVSCSKSCRLRRAFCFLMWYLLQFSFYLLSKQISLFISWPNLIFPGADLCTVADPGFSSACRMSHHGPLGTQDNSWMCDGSVIGFSGLLACLSLLLPFLVRKLPGIFNEAKLITISMPIFFTVWVAIAPTYIISTLSPWRFLTSWPLAMAFCSVSLHKCASF